MRRQAAQRPFERLGDPSVSTSSVARPGASVIIVRVGRRDVRQHVDVDARGRQTPSSVRPPRRQHGGAMSEAGADRRADHASAHLIDEARRRRRRGGCRGAMSPADQHAAGIERRHPHRDAARSSPGRRAPTRSAGWPAPRITASAGTTTPVELRSRVRAKTRTGVPMARRRRRSRSRGTAARRRLLLQRASASDEIERERATARSVSAVRGDRAGIVAASKLQRLDTRAACGSTISNRSVARRDASGRSRCAADAITPATGALISRRWLSAARIAVLLPRQRLRLDLQLLQQPAAASLIGMVGLTGPMASARGTSIAMSRSIWASDCRSENSSNAVSVGTR